MFFPLSGMKRKRLDPLKFLLALSLLKTSTLFVREIVVLEEQELQVLLNDHGT